MNEVITSEGHWVAGELLGHWHDKRHKEALSGCDIATKDWASASDDHDASAWFIAHSHRVCTDLSDALNEITRLRLALDRVKR